MARVPITEAALGAGTGGYLIALTGASMQVNVHGGGAATVYLDESSGTTVTNPLTSTNGRVSGWLAEGTYDLVVTYQAVAAPAVVFNARAAYPSGASDGQVLTWDTATTGVEWSDPSALTGTLAWTIDVCPFTTPATQTNWSTINTNTSSVFNGYKSATGAQNAEIGWDVVLNAGTWTISIVHPKSTDGGIITASLDAVSVGTMDMYIAAGTFNNVSTITGIVVATSGKKRLLMKMATKNASSSSYACSLSTIRLLRTA